MSAVNPLYNGSWLKVDFVKISLSTLKLSVLRESMHGDENLPSFILNARTKGAANEISLHSNIKRVWSTYERCRIDLFSCAPCHFEILTPSLWSMEILVLIRNSTAAVLPLKAASPRAVHLS